MKRFYTALLTFLIVILSTWSFLGCGGANLPGVVEDGRIVDQILDFTFNDFVRTPGQPEGGYSDLLTDAHTDRATYLTEYGAPDEGYYLVYLKRSLIDQYEAFLLEHEQAYANNVYDYHFSAHDQYEIIDGKYLYCHQHQATSVKEGVKVCFARDIADIPYKLDAEYQLVFCAQTKPAVIKANLSNGQQLDRPITLYKKTVISFDEENGRARAYEFGYTEGEKQTRDNRWFEFEGLIIEEFSVECEGMDYAPISHRGNTHYEIAKQALVVEKNDAYYVALPRYLKNNGDPIDLLDATSGLTGSADIFGTEKARLAQAFDCVFEEDVPAFLADSRYEFGLYKCSLIWQD